MEPRKNKLRVRYFQRPDADASRMPGVEWDQAPFSKLKGTPKDQLKSQGLPLPLHDETLLSQPNVPDIVRKR